MFIDLDVFTRERFKGCYLIYENGRETLGKHKEVVTWTDNRDFRKANIIMIEICAQY